MCEICDMSIRDWRLTIVLEIELLFLEQPRRKGSVADLSAMKPLIEQRSTNLLVNDK